MMQIDSDSVAIASNFDGGVLTAIGRTLIVGICIILQELRYDTLELELSLQKLTNGRSK